MHMKFRVEIRNNRTLGSFFEKRDILESISNSAAGIDLFGH
jgi:hypothetical protein